MFTPQIGSTPSQWAHIVNINHHPSSWESSLDAKYCIFWHNAQWIMSSKTTQSVIMLLLSVMSSSVLTSPFHKIMLLCLLGYKWYDAIWCAINNLLWRHPRQNKLSWWFFCDVISSDITIASLVPFLIVSLWCHLIIIKQKQYYCIGLWRHTGSR